MDALRMEKGFKMWGNEMNLDVDAWEAGLAPFIRMKKTVREISAVLVLREAIQIARETY